VVIYDNYYRSVYARGRPTVYSPEFRRYASSLISYRSRSSHVSSGTSYGGFVGSSYFDYLMAELRLSLERGDYARARRIQRELESYGVHVYLPPRPPAREEGYVDVLARRVKHYLDKGDLDRAREAAEKLLRISRGLPEYQEYAREVLRSIREYEAKVREYEMKKAVLESLGQQYSIDYTRYQLKQPGAETLAISPSLLELKRDIEWAEFKKKTGLKRYEDIIFSPSIRLAEPVKYYMLEKAFEARSKGRHYIGLPLAIGAAMVSTMQGVYEGIAGLAAPWKIGEGLYTLYSRPGEVIGYYASNPLEIPRLAGSIAAGYMVGKFVGKAFGKIRSRFSKPQEFELTATEFKTLRTMGTIEDIGQYKYKLTASQYIEKGIAKPVYSLGQPRGLVGEYSFVVTRKGPWTSIRFEGWKIPKAKFFLEKPVRVSKAIIPSGKGEFTIGKTFEAYGFGGKAPYLFSKEIVSYGSKPIWFSESILKDIRVFIKQPNLFKRFIGWFKRKPSVPEITYTAKGASRTGSFMGYNFEAGGVVPRTILEIPKASTIIHVSPNILYDFSAEFAFAAGLSNISLPLNMSSVSNKPVIRQAIFQIPRIKALSRSMTIPMSISFISSKSATRTLSKTLSFSVPRLQAPRLAIRTKQLRVRAPSLIMFRKLSLSPSKKTSRRRVRKSYRERVNPFNLWLF